MKECAQRIVLAFKRMISAWWMAWLCYLDKKNRALKFQLISFLCALLGAGIVRRGSRDVVGFLLSTYLCTGRYHTIITNCLANDTLTNYLLATDTSNRVGAKKLAKLMRMIFPVYVSKERQRRMHFRFDFKVVSKAKIIRTN